MGNIFEKYGNLACRIVAIVASLYRPRSVFQRQCAEKWRLMAAADVVLSYFNPAYRGDGLC